MNPLVSMVVPCYNVEKKIINLLESVVRQTYTNVETIFVDDGSKDNTKEVIYSYKEKIEELGMRFIYVKQENSGAAGAVRTGLDYVTGKYLIWPDADDFLTEDSIEKKVTYLEKNPQYSMVRTNAYVVNSDNIDDRKKLLVKEKNMKREKIYNECIRFKMYICSGCYMIRWADYLKVNPEKYIYKTYFGQNIQMLLPIAYNYKCGYIDEPLYIYIIYKDSHSRLNGNRTYERSVEYSKNVEEIMISTMKAIGINDKKDYLNVQNDFCVRRLRIAYNAQNRVDQKKEYKNIKGIRKFNPITILLSVSRKNKFVDILDRINQIFDIALFQLLNRR